MKVLLDIKDDKASSLLEVLKGLSYVKMKPISSSKAYILESMKEAADQMNAIAEGKLKARDAKEFINEL